MRADPADRTHRKRAIGKRTASSSFPTVRSCRTSPKSCSSRSRRSARRYWTTLSLSGCGPAATKSIRPCFCSAVSFEDDLAVAYLPARPKPSEYNGSKSRSVWRSVQQLRTAFARSAHHHQCQRQHLPRGGRILDLEAACLRSEADSSKRVTAIPANSRLQLNRNRSNQKQRFFQFPTASPPRASGIMPLKGNRVGTTRVEPATRNVRATKALKESSKSSEKGLSQRPSG